MFLKNKNIIFKIRRSKVTDYAALRVYYLIYHLQVHRTLVIVLVLTFVLFLNNVIDVLITY